MLQIGLPQPSRDSLSPLFLNDKEFSKEIQNIFIS